MKIDAKKLEIILARQSKVMRDLRDGASSSRILARISRGEEVTPRAVKRIAEALGVPMTDILDDEPPKMKDNPKDKKERLEKALLEFIEREAQEPSSDAAVQALPEMAEVVLELWGF